MNSEYIAIAVILVIAVLLLKVFSTGPRKHKDCRYRRKHYLLSKAERSFYGVLRQAAGSDSLVFCKVRVADVLAPAQGLGNKDWRIALNRIVAKHFDFVLCDPESLVVKGVVELHDKSHKSKSRASRDRLLRDACASADLRLFEFEARAGYNVHQLRAVLLRDGVSQDTQSRELATNCACCL